jgi:hypothetical protein
LSVFTGPHQDVTTEITVKREDVGRATLICQQLIEKEKAVRKKWAETEPSMMDKFLNIFRLW